MIIETPDDNATSDENEIAEDDHHRYANIEQMSEYLHVKPQPAIVGNPEENAVTDPTVGPNDTTHRCTNIEQTSEYLYAPPRPVTIEAFQENNDEPKYLNIQQMSEYM